jgi:creatinase
MTTIIERPDFFIYENGEKAKLPFGDNEYAKRHAHLREVMQRDGLDAILFTSMHNVAYYSGFLYCAFGRPYACVITPDACFTISANIDAGQPFRRSVGNNLVYTDWKKDNYWRAIRHIIGESRRLGVESDHLTLTASTSLDHFLNPAQTVNVADICMQQRMIKSAEEIVLIEAGAAIADLGGEAVRDAIKPGKTELDVAMAARDVMEQAIAQRFPDAEYRDTWVWLQSGINTDGAHNPVTSRKLRNGDILSMNTFPMINGYYTALERTLFVGSVDDRSLEIWQANVDAHELGQSLLKPGVSCEAVCAQINQLFEDRGLLQYRSFGYGHSFGVLSHYYGREAGLELREDNPTVLEPGMVISMEPMLTIPDTEAGAGGYREHDILVIEESGSRNITKFPYGPAHNVIA